MKKQLLLLIISLVSLAPQTTTAQSKDISGPAGSELFGYSVTVLPNGNYVVTDPYYDEGGKTNIGAVYLYNGKTHVQVSKMTGSTAGDQVGYGNITILTNGNYLIGSPFWSNAGTWSAGALTLANASTGINGVVSSSNSLVGSSMGDNIGGGIITPLPNGNYVVSSLNWDNGAFQDAGAVTWGSGTTGVNGVITSSNSLVGTKYNDQIGSKGIFVLTNGNYVILTWNWSNGNVTWVGAVTWGSGTAGVSGIISSENSLIGTKAYDQIGARDVTVLTNGNYVVNSPYWDNGSMVDAGAVTWGNGEMGVKGEINRSNSLVGSTADNAVGLLTEALPNGNYVVNSQNWDNGGIINAGALTWGNGTVGVVGVVSSSNSLVGSTAYDQVGRFIILSNGNYVAITPYWDNGSTVDVGAATWGDGTIGLTGVISTSNSLVGTTTSDQVGFVASALKNGNYVVHSRYWDHGSIADAGAATWGNGNNGLIGVVGSSNSLVGSSANDQVGLYGTALSNGNFVIWNPFWDNGSITDAGATTWINGTTGATGSLNNSNSLVGTAPNDQVGGGYVFALTNGNYVVRTTTWDNGGVVNVGAITWGNGTSGVSGVVNVSNSLVGTSANDQIGNEGIELLSNGNYIVKSKVWDNGALADAGAITWGSGVKGVSGIVNSDNSLVGSSANDLLGTGISIMADGSYIVSSTSWDNGGTSNAGAITLGNGVVGVTGEINSCNSVLGTSVNGFLQKSYNPVHKYLLVGLPYENKLTIFTPTGMNLSATLEETTVDISGEGSVPLVANANCQIIANLVANGDYPVQGLVHAKTWVEGSVPSHDGQPFVARHYQITPDDNASTATGRLTLYFTQAEFNAFNSHSGSILNLPANGTDAMGKNNLRIMKFSGRSSDDTGLPDSYENGSLTIDPDDDDIVWNEELSRWEVSFDVEGFSGFIVQTEFDPLPVRLISFKGKAQENTALLDWKIADAYHFSHFEVERSKDAKSFEPLRRVELVKEKSTYQFTDENASLGTNDKNRVYYRLKLMDLDGTFAYSKMAELEFVGSASNYVYPNPFTSSMSVALKNHNGETVTVDLRNQSGELLLSKKVSVTDNKLDFEIGKTKLSAGTYILTIQTASEVVNLKVVKE